jgi:predicted RNA-binding protein YlqC (UPF0109 family)
MSLNSSLPQLTSKAASQTVRSAEKLDYVELVRFLIQPFLESPNSLSVDCETSTSTSRVWIRVAFEGEDKGRVFGRGGRNIQSIRTVIAAAAALAGHSVYLDIYGSQAFNSTSESETPETRSTAIKSKDQRGNSPKPTIKPRQSISD